MPLAVLADPLRRMGAEIAEPVPEPEEETGGSESEVEHEVESVPEAESSDDPADGGETDVAPAPDTLPLRVQGGGLAGIEFTSESADPILKWALLLAGLKSRSSVQYSEPMRSPDHLEKLIRTFGADLETRPTGGGRGEYEVRLDPGIRLEGREVEVPADFSKAVYLMVAALVLPRSDLILKDVGLSPSRREALNILKRMGGKIEILERRTVGMEPRADIQVKRSKLKGVGVSGGTVRMLFEEIAALTVAAVFAEGETYFKGARELRQPASDRISALIHNLKVLSLDTGEAPDGLVFRGKSSLDGGVFDSFGDYRVALAFHVCALASHGDSTILNYEVIDQFWPGFPDVIEILAT